MGWLTLVFADIERVDVQYTVRYYGHVVEDYALDETPKYAWEGGELVRAVGMLVW